MALHAKEFLNKRGLLYIMSQCCVYPQHPVSYMPVLGRMSRVTVWNGGPSPTGIPHELPISYVDASGQERHGWIEPWAQVAIAANQNKKLKKHEPHDTTARLSPIDNLRDACFGTGQTLFGFMANEGHHFTPRLKKVIRELGGTTKASDDHDTILIKAMRMLHDREVTMKEVDEARSTAKAKRAGKKVAKKGKKEKSAKSESAGSRSNSMRVSCGNALVPLLQPGAARKAAKRLQMDEALSAKELTALRDGVNEQAATAREAGDGKLASKLSAANRIVRRLARSSK